MSLSFFQRLQLDNKVRKEWYAVLGSMTDASTKMAVASALQQMSAEFKLVKQPVAPLVDELILRMTGGRASSVTKSLRLGDSLGGLVPANEAMMIKAGEEHGELSRGLQQASFFVGAIDGLMGAVRKAMGLSIMYGFVIFAIYVFFGIELLPQMELTAKRATWPAAAQTFGFVADNILWIAGIAAAIVGFVWISVKKLAVNWTGKARDFADEHIWPFKTIRLLNASAMLMGLSGFIKAGVPFDQAIKTLAEASNPYMKSKYARTTQAGKRGERDFDALLASGLLPKNRHWIVRCYGKTSDFGLSIEKIAEDFVKFATERTEKMATWLNLFFMVLTAANLGWVALSITSIVKSVR